MYGQRPLLKRMPKPLKQFAMPLKKFEKNLILFLELFQSLKLEKLL